MILNLPAAIKKALEILRKEGGIDAGITPIYGTNQYVISLPNAQIKEEDDHRSTTQVPIQKH